MSRQIQFLQQQQRNTLLLSPVHPSILQATNPTITSPSSTKPTATSAKAEIRSTKILLRSPNKTHNCFITHSKKPVSAPGWRDSQWEIASLIGNSASWGCAKDRQNRSQLEIGNPIGMASFGHCNTCLLIRFTRRLRIYGSGTRINFYWETSQRNKACC